MPFKRRSLDKAARVFTFVASIFLLFMMLFTTSSVVLRYIASWNGETDVDIMVWAFAACIFIAMPAVTLRDHHVAVDLIDHLVKPKRVTWLRWIGLLFIIGFLAVSFFEAVPSALDKLEGGENTMSLDINRFWFWLPMMIGLALAGIAAVLVGVSWWRHGQPPAHSSEEPL